MAASKSSGVYWAPTAGRRNKLYMSCSLHAVLHAARQLKGSIV